MATAVASGASKCGMWPASGILIHRAGGSACCIRSAIVQYFKSCSPLINRVGHCSWLSCGQRLGQAAWPNCSTLVASPAAVCCCRCCCILARQSARICCWLRMIGVCCQNSRKVGTPSLMIRWARAVSLVARAMRSAWSSMPGLALMSIKASQCLGLSMACRSAARAPIE